MFYQLLETNREEIDFLCKKMRKKIVDLYIRNKQVKRMKFCRKRKSLVWYYQSGRDFATSTALILLYNFYNTAWYRALKRFFTFYTDFHSYLAVYIHPWCRELNGFFLFFLAALSFISSSPLPQDQRLTILINYGRLSTVSFSVTYHYVSFREGWLRLLHAHKCFSFLLTISHSSQTFAQLRMHELQKRILENRRKCWKCVDGVIQNRSTL